VGRIRIYPYKQGSRSALALAGTLNGRVLRLQGSTFQPRSSDFIINWGSSAPSGVPFVPLPSGEDYICNHPASIARASNKLSAFQAMGEAGVSIPAFAASQDTVSWEGKTVVRHKLSGHSGDGIEIVDSGPLPQAPLYVQYIPKKEEYRVHVIGQSIIAIQRKARRLEVENPNWQVRNHDNGFVFVREGFTAPQSVSEQARMAIAALGLDFGAVDIIWNEQKGKAYVLEVNTAPGLEGQTIADYAEGFRRLIAGTPVDSPSEA